ncbi:hypothetical protein MIR68_006813 [Amoeboaphelidium protococcarum]|nr:hypothetical protein MIR68_006813 [Amoeboaphelidium protococcarum]
MSKNPPLKFEVLARCSTTKARVSKMILRHAVVVTPVFMPVGTQGAMKGVSVDQLRDVRCNMILGNTYHLGMRPGEQIMQKMGGLHKFMNWDHGLLTDSGGFQMVSLLKLSSVSEDGVHFIHPHTQEPLLLTPERSMQIQNSIGADIMMQLDDVVSSLTVGDRVVEAMHRSIRWLDRCIESHQRPNDQSLFAIIQGGLDKELRSICLEEMIKRDTPGYAIGGLSGGEEKDKFWRIVSHCTESLPEYKPRYCMGVGYALDLVVCVALGVDMFDCVFPTRTARFGNALTRYGSIKLTNSQYKHDYRPIEDDCDCLACTQYTRASLNPIVCTETVGCNLVSIHNIAYQMRLMREMREAIMKDQFPQFVKKFVKDYHTNSECPQWAINALKSVNIDV